MGFINNGKWEEVPCNICGCSRYNVLYKSNLTPQDLKESPSGFGISSDSPRHPQVVSCDNCGLMYANPREKAQELLRNYSSVEDEGYLLEEANRRATFLKDLRFIEKYSPRKGRLLDIGCFAGFFMDTARQGGWEVFGVEPSAWASAYGREKLNLNIISGTLEDASFPKGHFDLILMWDVLEHIDDPKKTIAACAGLLKDKGLLAINTPDFGSIFSRLLKESFWFIERTHLYYFTAESLKRLLCASGLELISIRRHWRNLNAAYLMNRIKTDSRQLSRFLGPLSHIRTYLYFGQMTLIVRKAGRSP